MEYQNQFFDTHNIFLQPIAGVVCEFRVLWAYKVSAE